MPSIQDNIEELEIIKEEQLSPVPSMKLRSSKQKLTCTPEKKCKCCGGAQAESQTQAVSVETKGTKSVDQDLKEKENILRAEYDKLLEKKIALARERFNYILQNEQLRACYMLREAHRERQEKVKALESQLECKNLAALMYVVCTERQTSKLEKLRLIEDYTTYINGLQDILTDAQQLILYLSRGYKTAARVDYEWREKMTSIIGEFMKFIYNFAGGPREMNQYFIDMPKLMKTEASLADDPEEDPCESEEVEEEQIVEKEDEEKKPWWDMMDSDNRPFVMFGDMAEFKPPQRRQVLNTIKTVKAEKTAPPIWKKYIFNEMTLRRSCDNVDEIKDVFPHPRQLSMISEHTPDSSEENKNVQANSRLSVSSRRVTLTGNNDMGSLLKIITSTNMHAKKPNEPTALLAVRDSIEICSSTRLRHMSSKPDTTHQSYKAPVVLDIGKRSIVGLQPEDLLDEQPTMDGRNAYKQGPRDVDLEPSTPTGLGSAHHDSMEVIPTHKAEKDHINYERCLWYRNGFGMKSIIAESGARNGGPYNLLCNYLSIQHHAQHWDGTNLDTISIKYCPVDKCQRLQVDSFIRSLPPYMRASPFTQFQQTYEEYETCSPEQLEILKQRLEAKRAAGPEDSSAQENEPSLSEWAEEGGVGTQTSLESMLPPCTCTDDDQFSPVDSKFVFDIRDLIPVKQALDEIKKECMYDDKIDFDRFKVIGQESDQTM